MKERGLGEDQEDGCGEIDKREPQLYIYSGNPMIGSNGKAKERRRQ